MDYLEKIHANESEALHDRSGKVCTGSYLASFLYDLMLDHLPPGKVEDLVVEAECNYRYSNGWLALYAQDLADRLTGKIVVDEHYLDKACKARAAKND